METPVVSGPRSEHVPWCLQLTYVSCPSVWHQGLSMMNDSGQLESQSVSSHQRIMSAGATLE